jgi:hypothetical protein
MIRQHLTRLKGASQMCLPSLDVNPINSPHLIIITMLPGFLCFCEDESRRVVRTGPLELQINMKQYYTLSQKRIPKRSNQLTVK